jgi:HSP20 family protein
MTIYISNPYRRMSAFRQAMDRLLEDSFSQSEPEARDLTLAVDVTSDDEGYILKAFIPGLGAEELEIEVLNNTVSIQGEFKEADVEKAKYLTHELPSGSFSRIVTLPTSLDAAKAEANINNGILVLKVPKAEAHRPKTIKVSTN